MANSGSWASPTCDTRDTRTLLERLEAAVATGETELAEMKVALAYLKANPGYVALSNVLGRGI